jgi:hypothetical protein
MRVRHIATAAVVLGSFGMIAGTIGTTAVAASAAPTMVTAITNVSDHPDTTSVSGPGCGTSANGPTWADDTYASTLTAVQTGTGTWRVTLDDSGTFAGFADPATCAPLKTSGSLLGLYTVTVASSHTPSQAALGAVHSGAESTTSIVQDFFGDPAAVVTGGDYFFDYQAGAYVQTTSSSYGDVHAAAPVMVTVPGVKGLSANAALAKVRAAGFTASTSPLRNSRFAYKATGTSPAGSAVKGSHVVVDVVRS